MVSDWTAHLKAHYRAEYMAALLESVRDDKDKSAFYWPECRHMGIKVLPPDVNSSQGRFTPVGRTSASGWARSATWATTWLGGILACARTTRRRPTSTSSSIDVPAVVCNKRVIESLIKAGAFD